MIISDQIHDESMHVLKELLKETTIQEFTDIQKKTIPFINTNDNLVIVAPSGAGKTLIAELIAIKDFIMNKEKLATLKTVFLVPLRALAEEKANEFAKNYRKFKLKIHMSMSDIDFNEKEIENCDILISTYERFKTILGRIPDLLSLIKNVVIDEFHLIGNQSRGSTLETILITLLEKVRLILLSATISNPQDIARWLNAKLIISDIRQVPLDFEIISSVQPEKEIKQIILNNIKNNSQVLIFCGTRAKTEENAIFYGKYINDICNQSEDFNPNAIVAYLKKHSLANDIIGNKLIYSLVKQGTAFHHAGLGRLTRLLIEQLFRENLIKILFCTETLGAGINLPVREVIILDVKRWNNEWLTRNTFHQIAGRAGRPNFDPVGKCIIMVNDHQEKELILSKYWQVKQNVNSIGSLKPKFDEVTSRLESKEELEKLILTLIFNNKPSENILLKLLKSSFFNFARKEAYEMGEENSVYDITNNSKLVNEEFFKILLNTNPNLSEMSFNIFEQLFPTNNLEIIKNYTSGDKQVLNLEDNKQNYFVMLGSNEFYCSCNPSSLLCRHKLFLLKQLPKSKVEEIVIKHISILHTLLTNNYIKEINGLYQTTIKGTICAEMGITQKNFESLKEMLQLYALRNEIILIQLLHDCLRIESQKEQELEGIFINNFDFEKPIYEHIILGKSMNDVLRKYQIYEGDLLRVELNLRTLISNIIPLADLLGLLKLKRNLELFEKFFSKII